MILVYESDGEKVKVGGTQWQGPREIRNLRWEGGTTATPKTADAALSADADIPSEVPLKYHPAIAEVYVKAKYYERLNRNYDASTLMNEWEGIKREIYKVTHHDRKADGDGIVDVYYDPQMSGGGSSW